VERITMEIDTIAFIGRCLVAGILIFLVASSLLRTKKA